ncbi:hypothetical protein [uncultured Tenacibaculum sp.]|uniref:hypothetical protein n=1 Tax=uncultured Tenacibaculum sp. TaxID=174713 RepID=UPI002605CA38|nr:hypothetical protein [uncultured Tenacibaculum sp.]
MKINLSKERAIRSSKKKLKKFLLLPLFHSGSVFWLEKVVIKKNFNGISYQITDVQRLKNI